MKYEIVIEGHSGVVDVDESVFMQVEADNHEHALDRAARSDSRIAHYKKDNVYMIGNHKLFAREKASGT